MNSLLTIKEVSEILRVSEKTIRRWTYNNSIPYMKLGGAIRFDERQIQIWLAKKSKKREKRFEKEIARLRELDVSEELIQKLIKGKRN
ncbi:helix-turn-helix domain-containing protein [bacterium]|nr:helix-turn-helix domain-containing protein [bacterium]